MSIETRIQAINDHLIDDYKVLRLAGADLTGVNKNIVNLKMSWKERLLYFMNNGTDEVWNNWDKVSGTGTSLSLNNTEEAPMSLVYKGNTSQSGTPTPTSPIPVQVVSGDNSINVVGKNIIDLSTATKSGWNYVIDNPIKEAGTYTISVTQKTTKPGAVAFRNSLNDSNIGGYFAGYIFGDGILSSTKEITQEQANAKYIIWLGNGDEPLDELKSIFMLAKGTDTTYEEYKSASYPISLGDKELCKIGTYQDKIDKSTGRNLCGYDNTLPYTSGGVTLTREENSYYKTSGTSSVWFNKNVYTIPAGTLNGTYKTKKIQYSGTNEASIRIVDRTVSPVFIYAETNSSQTFTISNNNNLSVEVVVSLNHSSNETFNILLQKSTETDETYEPYGTGWYLKKEIGKVVLNGSETKWYTFGGANYEYQAIINDGYSGSDFKPSISNRYVNNNVTGANLQNYQYSCFIQSGEMYVRFRHNDITTLEDYKTWLGTHNTEVIYPLATPTYETITDTTLIGQLEALKKSYEGQTNISQANNDLPFELNITALSNE